MDVTKYQCILKFTFDLIPVFNEINWTIISNLIKIKMIKSLYLYNNHNLPALMSALDEYINTKKFIVLKDDYHLMKSVILDTERIVGKILSFDMDSITN